MTSTTSSTPAAPAATLAPTRSKADFLPIGLCILLWSWNTPMYRYLQNYHCDAYTMSFYRTLTAALAVTVWELAVSGPKAMVDEARRQRWMFVLLAFLFMAGMLAGVEGTFDTSATLAILLNRATPLVALTLSAVLYIDEQRLIRRPDFLVGFCLALVGLLGLSLVRSVPPPEPGMTAATHSAANGLQQGAADLRSAITGEKPVTIASDPPAPAEDHYVLGVGLLLLCALMWGSYSAVVKGMVTGARPFTITAITFWLAAAMALPFLLWKGEPGWIIHAGGWPIFILVASGALMGLAEGLFYLSVNRLGLAPSTSATLLVPFFTALIAWQFLGEKITWVLIAFGVLLLTGLGVIVLARTRLLAGQSMAQPLIIAGRAGIAPLTIGETAQKPAEPHGDD
ncbi:MAG TPA: DMT family transporter [Planctomycetota bacterium]|nr:DMT family transporter [Planctomycetota bacterium]